MAQGLSQIWLCSLSTPSFWCMRRDKAEATGEEQRRSGIRKFTIELRLPLPRTLMPHKLVSGDSFAVSGPSIIDTELWSSVLSAMSLPVRGPIGALDSGATAPEESMLAAGHMLSRGSKARSAIRLVGTCNYFSGSRQHEWGKHSGVSTAWRCRR